jgi:phosphoglycolate phosphatase-like HAD superfamily hydrolase
MPDLLEVSHWKFASIFVVIVCFCFLWKGTSACTEEESVAIHTPEAVYHCPTAAAPDPDQHEKFLDRLNATRVVFIGDSITRSSTYSLS